MLRVPNILLLSDLYDIWPRCAQQYCPIICGLKFWFLLCIFLIKSLRYIGGYFVFVPVRTPPPAPPLLASPPAAGRRPQTIVHMIAFEQLFGFLSFLTRLLALTNRLPDKILVDFCHDLDLEFSRSDMEFAISQSKIVDSHVNEKQTYRLNSRPQMWPSGLTLAMTLTLNFQDQAWNLLYLNQKWSDCHETKSKHIDWTQGLKCYHWVWPWPWPWPWNLLYLSQKWSDWHETKSKLTN